MRLKHFTGLGTEPLPTAAHLTMPYVLLGVYSRPTLCTRFGWVLVCFPLSFLISRSHFQQTNFVGLGCAIWRHHNLLLLLLVLSGNYVHTVVHPEMADLIYRLSHLLRWARLKGDTTTVNSCHRCRLYVCAKVLQSPYRALFRLGYFCHDDLFLVCRILCFMCFRLRLCFSVISYL